MMRVRVLAALIALGACSADGSQEGDSSTTASISSVDVLALAGKTPVQVEALLGAPSSRETTKNDGVVYPDLYYQGDSVEVVYVDGRAEWISVYRLTNLPFSPDALRALGIATSAPPSFSGQGVIRWENFQHPKFKGVYLFPSVGGRVDHAYIQVTREP